HNLTRGALQFFQAAPNQFDRGQFRKQAIVSRMTVSRPLPTEQPCRVGAGLVDETQKHFRWDGNAGLVVVPRPGGKIEAAGELWSAVLAKDLLADFSQTTR